jgi:hypothetical protein
VLPYLSNDAVLHNIILAVFRIYGKEHHECLRAVLAVLCCYRGQEVRFPRAFIAGNCKRLSGARVDVRVNETSLRFEHRYRGVFYMLHDALLTINLDVGSCDRVHCWWELSVECLFQVI